MLVPESWEPATGSEPCLWKILGTSNNHSVSGRALLAGGLHSCGAMGSEPQEASHSFLSPHLLIRFLQLGRHAGQGGRPMSLFGNCREHGTHRVPVAGGMRAASSWCSQCCWATFPAPRCGQARSRLAGRMRKPCPHQDPGGPRAANRRLSPGPVAARTKTGCHGL